MGLSEGEAQAQKIPYEVTRYGIDDLDRAIADGEAQVLLRAREQRRQGATYLKRMAGGGALVPTRPPSSAESTSRIPALRRHR